MSIGELSESVSEEPNLVEAELLSIERRGDYVESATLKINRVLKGHIDSGQIKVVDTFCYQSLTTDRMKVGHIYVLPLSESNDETYEMLSCAHSGAELIDGKLYTFELTEDGEREQHYYQKYERFLRKHDQSRHRQRLSESAR